MGFQFFKKRKINTWSRNQLAGYITYKSEDRGKPTIKVNPYKNKPEMF